jgi:hypothetical protein
MTFVYPQSILAPRHPDEMFQEEADTFSQAGYAVALIDSEKLTSNQSGIKPPIDSGATVVYRGWMLTSTEYNNYVQSVIAAGGSPITSTQQYLATHHLPNWYRIIPDLTPETVILPLDSDWTTELTKLGWSRFFIKDYVKSLKTSIGSIIERPEDIHTVTEEMQKYRGTIEGGLCVRRVEDFLPDSERRFFVVNGKPYDADSQTEIPANVFECTNRISSNFYSVDVICRLDGQLRIVEIGDGQVSDLVGWSVKRFLEIWQSST